MVTVQHMVIYRVLLNKEYLNFLPKPKWKHVFRANFCHDDGADTETPCTPSRCWSNMQQTLTKGVGLFWDRRYIKAQVLTGNGFEFSNAA